MKHQARKFFGLAVVALAGILGTPASSAQLTPNVEKRVVVEPMLFTLGVTTMWTLTKSIHGSSLPIVAFALTGYSAVLLWRNMPARCIGAIRRKLPALVPWW